MDVLKLSTDWANAEVFSSKITLLLGILFLVAAFCFKFFGKTLMANAFFLPLLVSALLVIIIAAGLFFANKPRILAFEKAFQSNQQLFIQAEITRTAKSKNELALALKVLPAIIIAASILIISIQNPQWKAIGITTVLLMVTLMLIDSNTEARNTAYHLQLISLAK